MLKYIAFNETQKAKYRLTVKVGLLKKCSLFNEQNNVSPNLNFTQTAKYQTITSSAYV